MNITTVRRTSQAVFFFMFLWFTIVNTVGGSFWQIRGWPVNLFLELDPLTAVATVLSTGVLYRGLAWAAATVIITILLGRFFCGWLCPFGTLHHFISYLIHRKKSSSEKIRLNSYHDGQKIKYLILIAFLVMALFPPGSGGIQTGLLDAVPLFTRTVNLVLLPLADTATKVSFPADRFYEGGFLIIAVFIILTLLNFLSPRFFCRYICPLGALTGTLSRFAIFRIGQNDLKCHECGLCDRSCEGACEPSKQIRHSSCILCFNCMDDCPHETISYQTKKSTAGEITSPGISRGAFLASLGSGILLLPSVRLSGITASNWRHDIIRPPGSLAEEDFLKRCVKCGQCMRICPTNIIQPGGLDGGIENLWTPELNFRAGTSGCQYNCAACGQACPTGAIRPFTLEEKQGKGAHKKQGPLRIGTAFFDRSRCLPWAMDIPCIVCQENCPVSPKAIYTDEYFSTVRNGIHEAEILSGNSIILKKAGLRPGQYATGDYYINFENFRYRMISHDSREIITEEKMPRKTGATLEIQVRLQRPYMDISKCTGCGICEHECPVEGLKAVRVSAEGESRSPEKKMILKKKQIKT